MNYKKNLWDDSFKENAEEGIVVNFEAVPANVNYMIFYIIV